MNEWINVQCLNDRQFIVNKVIVFTDNWALLIGFILKKKRNGHKRSQKRSHLSFNK